jgi:hypothetical protein
MNREEFDRVLSALSPEDFDGHTAFHQFTPEQKLMWLSQIAQFVVEAREWRKSYKEAQRAAETENLK